MGLESDLVPIKRDRVRRIHRKVKTGCGTCKIRRKKCDEARPFCNLCTSTGRKCDGYLDSPPTSHPIPPLVRTWDWQECAVYPTFQTTRLPTFRPRSYECHRHCTCPPNLASKTIDHLPTCLNTCPLYARSPAIFQLASEIEYICFDFFRHKTGPGFAGYFDSSLWSALILEACFTNPIVLQAVAAVGAVHRRYELGITPQAFKYCEIADRLYRKALRDWNAALNDGTADDRPEIYMALAKLFGTFETFQDNPDLATRYMTSCFTHLLTQPVELVLSERQPVDVVLNEQTLRQYFLKLEHQAAYLFGTSTEVIWDIISKYPPDFSMPTVFTSIEEARNCLFAEVRAIWDLPPSTSSRSPLTDQITAIHHTHLTRLMAWSAAYGEYSQIHRPTNDALLRRIGSLLHWYREATFLQLLLQTDHNINKPTPAIDTAVIIPSQPSSNNTQQDCIPLTINKSHCSCPASIIAHFARLQLLSDGLIDDAGPGGPQTAQSGGKATGGKGMHTGLGLHLSCRSSEVRSELQRVLGAKFDLHKIESHLQTPRKQNGSGSASMSDALATNVETNKSPNGRGRHQGIRRPLHGWYGIAERLISLEELAVEESVRHNTMNTATSSSSSSSSFGFNRQSAAAGDGGGCLDRAGDVGKANWVDITCYMETRMLSVVSCREQVNEGGSGTGFLWCRDWYKLRPLDGETGMNIQSPSIV